MAVERSQAGCRSGCAGAAVGDGNGGFARERRACAGVKRDLSAGSGADGTRTAAARAAGCAGVGDEAGVVDLQTEVAARCCDAGELDCARARERSIERAGVASIDFEACARAALVVDADDSRRIGRVDVSVAGVGALVGLEAVEAAGGGVGRPGVAGVLDHVPLAGAVPVLVDERFFLRSGCAGPEEVVDLGVGLILYGGRADKRGRTADEQIAVEAGVAGAVDGGDGSFRWSA